MPYLMSISLGPVQDFIASARRSRDLWFGSWLLSELSRAAAQALVTNHAQDLTRLIFPAVDDLQQLVLGDKFSVVNKIVALVEDPQQTGRAIQEALTAQLNEIRKSAYREIRGKFDEAKAKQQVDDLPEFFWAAAEFPADGDYV